MTKIKTFSVEEIDGNARLDKFLAHKLKTITRTQIKKIIMIKFIRTTFFIAYSYLINYCKLI